MSRSPDPTAGIVVSGGVTRVEVEALVAAAATVLEAALHVEASLDQSRRAYGLVSGLVEALPSSVRWGGGTAACYSALGAAGSSGWAPVPTEVVAARSALLDETVACTDALLRAQEALVGLFDRLRKAAGIYEEGESRAEGSLSWLAGVPGIGIGVALAAGLYDVGKGIGAGRGVQPWRLVTGSSEFHDEVVRGTSRIVGLGANVRGLGGPGGWFREATVEDAAGVLGDASRSYRRLFAPGVVTTELTGTDLPDGFDKPVARSAEDLLSGIDVVYGTGDDLPDSVVSVEKYLDQDRRATWVVTVPGTQLGSLTTPFSMTSNFDLVQGEHADSTAHVLEAMRQAGIPEGEEVVLVGHSQGGMVAMAVATAVTGAGGVAGASGTALRYDVRQVLTAGAPVGLARLPAGVRGTHVEIEQEGVSQLDGTDNPVGPDRVTVRADLGARGVPGADGAVPHGVPFHVEVLGRAREVGQPGLVDNLDALEKAVSGERVEGRYFRGALDPLPVAPP
ncbi:alpha/beta fold hydrolase [Oerskovia sp. NPDC057915]|uniref:alpha/beta fold hydrolase n=1 Tax=Oerskovia sp. NPDC057915 TaxID=3346280 RepID=UPI0036DC410A